jgi:hypothetical protein
MGLPDWLLFDITNAIAAETFAVVTTTGASGSVQLSTVAFDRAAVRISDFSHDGWQDLKLHMPFRGRLSGF